MLILVLSAGTETNFFGCKNFLLHSVSSLQSLLQALNGYDVDANANDHGVVLAFPLDVPRKEPGSYFLFFVPGIGRDSGICSRLHFAANRFFNEKC